MQTGTVILIVMAAYLAVMIGIGIYGRRYARSFKDSITGAKRSNTVMVLGAAVGAHIGSGCVVGGAESGATYGIAGAWYGIGCGVSWLLAGLLVVKYFYRRGYLSLSDYFRDRYQDKATRLIFSISTPLSYLAMFAAQILAGKAIFNAFGIDGNLSIAITAGVVFLYATLSGLWGAFMTSVIQVGVIVAGLLIGLATMAAQGGFSLIAQTLPASSFQAVPFSAEMLVLLTVPTILAALVDQSMFQRSASARNEKAAVRGHVIGGVLLMFIAVVPALLGMYGMALDPQGDSSNVFITLIMNNFPTLFTAILVAAIVSAIMSTGDAAFLGISANIVYDIYQNMINPDATEKQCKRMQMALNVLTCVLGVLIALRFNSILEILSMAYTILFAGCLIPFVGGLVWKRGNAQGALASSICGVACAMLITFGAINPPYGSIFPVIPAILGYVLVSLITPACAAAVPAES